MYADCESITSSPVMVNHGDHMASPSLPNGHGSKAAASSRQYSCKACYFSTPSMLQFLMHVEKKHFDCHTSKSDTSSHYAATPEIERKESFEGQDSSEPTAHITGISDGMKINHDKETPNEESLLDDTTVDESSKTEDPNYKVKHEVPIDGTLTDGSFIPARPIQPCKESETPTVSSHLPDENALTRLREITESVPSLPKNDTDEKKERITSHVVDTNTAENTAAEFSINQSKICNQTNSRGIKIDSIANSLQGCNASKTPLLQCNICSNWLPPNSSQCENCAQNFGAPSLQLQPMRIPQSMYDNAASAFPYRKSCLPQFKPSVTPQYPLLTDTAGRLKHLYSHDEHFRSLQSLMSSSSVTMPHTSILQSIHCDKDTWRDVQETLHQAFSSFPYLSPRETCMLANMTGLSVKQVKTLFVVARLQHGISWDQEEIKNSRKYLGIPRNRFESCYSK